MLDSSAAAQANDIVIGMPVLFELKANEFDWGMAKEEQYEFLRKCTNQTLVNKLIVEKRIEALPNFLEACQQGDTALVHSMISLNDFNFNAKVSCHKLFFVAKYC